MVECLAYLSQFPEPVPTKLKYVFERGQHLYHVSKQNLHEKFITVFVHHNVAFGIFFSRLFQATVHFIGETNSICEYNS